MKKQNGMSILSLLLTIIVLLILGAMVISLLLGEASTTTEEYETEDAVNESIDADYEEVEDNEEDDEE